MFKLTFYIKSFLITKEDTILNEMDMLHFG